MRENKTVKGFIYIKKKPSRVNAYINISYNTGNKQSRVQKTTIKIETKLTVQFEFSDVREIC